MSAVISEGDKVRSRHHLGYLNVEQAQTFVLGIPAAVQTTYMIEGALNRILPQALPKFIELLDRLDCVECELWGGMDLASVNKISEIEVNPTRRKELAGYYQIARQALANLLGIIPNPYDQRSWVAEAPLNVTVHS